jgi:type I restriction enzyme S subunit
MASEWAVRLLEDCMEAIVDYRGKTPRKTSGGIPLITAKVVKGGRIETPDEHIAPEDYESWMRRGIPKAGDVVLTTEAPLGETAQLGSERVALAQRIIALRGKPDVLDNTFLKFLMQSAAVQDQLRARASGTTVLGIKQSELRKISLTLPPLPEQRAIAQILGTLDDKIELNRQMNETLEAIARVIFKSWFVDFDPVIDNAFRAGNPIPSALAMKAANRHELLSRASTEGRDLGPPKHIADLFPDHFVDSELGPIPEGWEVKKLSELCSTQYGFTASAIDDPIGPKLLRVTDINKRNWIEWNEVPFCVIEQELKELYALKFGDIVVARMADPGKSAIIEEDADAVFASYLVRLKTASLAHSYYIYGFLKSDFYSDYAEAAKSGSVQTTMNAKVIVGADLVVPRKKVIEKFVHIVLPFRYRLVVNVRESCTLAALRDALLPKLISGELRVKDAHRIISEVP